MENTLNVDDMLQGYDAVNNTIEIVFEDKMWRVSIKGSMSGGDYAFASGTHTSLEEAMLRACKDLKSKALSTARTQVRQIEQLNQRVSEIDAFIQSGGGESTIADDELKAHIKELSDMEARLSE